MCVPLWKPGDGGRPQANQHRRLVIGIALKIPSQLFPTRRHSQPVVWCRKMVYPNLGIAVPDKQFACDFEQFQPLLRCGKGI